MTRITTLLAVAGAAFILGCGNNDTNGKAAPPAGDAGPESQRPTSDGPPSFGHVVVEAIENDGSEAGLGVSQELVIDLEEVRDALPMLASANLSVLLMVQAHRLDDAQAAAEVFTLIQEATEAGVEVHPIPVLSADLGYFPNATNYDAFAAVVRDLVAQWSDQGLDPTTLIVDMEPPRELTEALAEAEIFEAVPAGHIDRDRYAESQVSYAGLVDELHGLGWKVSVSTQGSLLADYRDDDDDLRQYFNVVLEGVAWDQMNFQLYRSLFSTQAEGLDSHFVYDFALAAQEQFPGMPIGVDLGVTHPGPVFPDMPSLPNPAALRDDVSAALAAGIEASHIGVYNLKGILHGAPECEDPCEDGDIVYGPNDPESWLVRVESPTPPPQSDATSNLWARFDAMDTVLNLSEASRDAPE